MLLFQAEYHRGQLTDPTVLTLYTDVVKKDVRAGRCSCYDGCCLSGPAVAVVLDDLSCPGQDRALILEDAAGGPRLVPAEWFVSRLADQGLYYGLKLSGIQTCQRIRCNNNIVIFNLFKSCRAFVP